mmetsp:Transcript_130780/g.364463  ORF Transcript_130780/g.364463 Transcript_130780/m.364463 type:complete len:286 (-) Transcript_130780:224-1081(-)
MKGSHVGVSGSAFNGSRMGSQMVQQSGIWDEQAGRSGVSAIASALCGSTNGENGNCAGAMSSCTGSLKQCGGAVANCATSSNGRATEYKAGVAGQQRGEFDLPVSVLERDSWIDRGEKRSLSAMETYRFMGEGPGAFMQTADWEKEDQAERCNWRLKRCAGILMLLVLADIIFLCTRRALSGDNATMPGAQVMAGGGEARSENLRLSACPLDCQDSEAGWSLAKKDFCCKQCSRGCSTHRESGTMATRVLSSAVRGGCKDGRECIDSRAKKDQLPPQISTRPSAR